MADDDEMVRFSQRLPKKLFEQVSAAAKASGRSINGEVIARLESTFDDTKERLIKLETQVFDPHHGDGLAWRVDNLEGEMNSLQRDVARLEEIITFTHGKIR